MTPVGVAVQGLWANGCCANTTVDAALAADPTDLTLLADFLAGQTSAFDELFVRLTPVIHKSAANAYARCHLRPSRDDLQETVQSIWAAVCARDYEVLRRFDPAHPQASVRAYIGRFALWRAIDFMRSAQRRGLDIHDGIDFERCAQLVDRFAEYVENRDYALTLFSLLYAELRPKGRVALTVLFLEGLTVTEAVRRTGLTESSLLTWRREIRRTARQIRLRLEREDDHAK